MSAIRRVTASNLDELFKDDFVSRLDDDYDELLVRQTEEYSIKRLTDLFEKDLVDNLEEIRAPFKGSRNFVSEKLRPMEPLRGPPKKK